MMTSSQTKTAAHPRLASRVPKGVRLRILMVFVFLKVLWLHFTCPQGEQFSRLGRHRRLLPKPLPDDWAWWAAHRIGRFVFRTPLIRRRPCYWRSQLIFDILPRFGFPVRMHLGTPRDSVDAAKCTAHVWVSLRGEVLGDSTDGPSRYVEMTCYKSE